MSGIQRNLLSPLSILMLVIVVAAVATWLIPAGNYDRLSYAAPAQFVYQSAEGEKTIPFSKQSLDSLKINIPLESFEKGTIKKPVSVPGTYRQMESKPQGFIDILQAPLKGIYESIDIILFILVIGGFMQLFNESGVMVRAVGALSRSMKGREAWLIIILTFLFSLGGASYGMAEEGMAFYAILIPIFIAAGYDLIVPVAVIFGGTQIGTLSSFSNPFSTIIASNAAGVDWTEGLYWRLLIFVITSAVFIIYVVRYAQKVKKDPTKSLLYLASPKPPFMSDTAATPGPLSSNDKLQLLLFFVTFASMIYGVVKKDWWLTEMTALFVGASILYALLAGIPENRFVAQFIKGAEGLLSVAFIVGVARGVTIILNDGNISDSIIYHAANFVSGMPPAMFIVSMMLMYMVFTLFISSSSGMAVLTMPIMGSLALMVNVPGREIVNAYLFGMGIIGFISPTGLILPALAISNAHMKAWLRFIFPLLIILTLLCAAFLIIGIMWK
jgi:uncharacterized ion transporter superfamily protein YfcC